MSSSTFAAGNSDGAMTGVCPAPPPPPPPPVPGQLPAMRIKTAEAPAVRRPPISNNEGYEPPAAIQNAMLTKDKKPFTYTPGMGGKLDLSQIRSPRMARRVAKNANDEGIEGPPKSAIEPKPAQTTPSVFVQPQVAVPVFPTSVPVLPPVNRTAPVPPTPPAMRYASNGNVPEKTPEPVRIVTKVEPRVIVPTTPGTPNTPESPNTPTQVTLSKAPTPWLQNKKSQEELPEWAKRTPGSKQNSASPESPTSPPIYTTQQVQPIQQPQWQPQPQPQQFNQQAQQKRQFTAPAQQAGPQSQQERVVPIRVEDRPSVFDVKHEGGHHQFKQQPPSPHHQQRWGQPGQNQVQAQQPMAVQPQQSSGGGYIIPIMVEGNEKRASSGPGSNTSYSQPPGRNSAPENQNARVVQQRGQVPVQLPGEPGPVQSRSFRVLQKITDTDVPNDVDSDQLRKLQLTDDDRVLMNKFKEQVDSDSFLHHEEDPRYRGAAIPSRAFRFLQTMTDGGQVPVASTAPRAQNSAINKKQNRNSKSFEESQANLPPSEQQVQEPKKYMGSAIPSRSFRILQAMTAPESVATQDNPRADYTCRTENSVPGNQQGVFQPPPAPPALWNPEGAWWGYYPLPFPGANNDPNMPYPSQDATAYIYYPIYNQNYPPYNPYVNANGDVNAYPAIYAPYVLPIAPQTNESNHLSCLPPDNSDLQTQDPILSVNGPKLTNHANNLNGVVHWDKNDNTSRAASSNSKDSDCTTAMNITDEEEIPETIVGTTEVVPQLETNEIQEPAGLNLAVPNYTYIDTSDSSQSTDSGSHSDNESAAESSKCSSISNNIAELDNTSSDSEDSDSYMAYSTGLNPQGRCEPERNLTSGDHTCQEARDSRPSSVEREEAQCEGSETEGSIPPKVTVNSEDIEQSEKPTSQDNRVTRVWSETPFEATDDPPDEADTTTVSVSLPLRFKFSVSENNEDVTTVIVGDSTIKEERQPVKDEPRISKNQENHTADTVNNVLTNYQVESETSVDFIVKRRQSSDVKRKVRNFEKAREEVFETRVNKFENDETPHVNFTLRKIPTRLGKMNCEEQIETEYTIKSKRTTRKEDAKPEKEQQVVGDGSVRTKDDTMAVSTAKGIGITRGTSKSGSESLANNINNAAARKADQNKFEPRDFDRNVVKPEVVVSECAWDADPNKTLAIGRNAAASQQESAIDTVSLPPFPRSGNSNLTTNRKIEDARGSEMEEKAGKEPKHLLSVQNSREETDDEDSGVTSDMSRIISEVDTDSECTSSKNIRKYQRTQTHSRLFRLLNDDSLLADSPQGPDETSSSRRGHLSLPLRSNAFSYDENYCSNYSSGVTSPEFSPVCEQSWRRLHDPDLTSSGPNDLHRLERPSSQEDPYYQAWKAPKHSENGNTDRKVLPTAGLKILEARRPFWPYKVNVLCPRIKSTKSVPQALRSSKSPASGSLSYVNAKSEHC